VFWSTLSQDATKRLNRTKFFNCLIAVSCDIETWEIKDQYRKKQSTEPCSMRYIIMRLNAIIHTTVSATAIALSATEHNSSVSKGTDASCRIGPSMAQPSMLRRQVHLRPREATSVQEQVSLCTQYTYYTANGCEILNKLWSKDQAISASQCTYYNDWFGSLIPWSTQKQWAGGENNVKSYAYAGRIFDRG
jgi:hypothetical protein